MSDWERLLRALRHVPKEEWVDGWASDTEVAMIIAEELGIDVPDEISP